MLATTQAPKRIITIDGCALNCSRKIVEQAGFTPTRAINLVTDCSTPKKPSSQFDPEEMQPAIAAIVTAINEDNKGVEKE